VQPVAYRRGYQQARENPDQFLPATGDQAERMIATLSATARAPPLEGPSPQTGSTAVSPGCAAAEDRNAVSDSGPTSQAWYRVGYQTGREHYQEIAARQNGDLASSCSYETHLGEVPTSGIERFVAGCIDGTSQASRLAVPNSERRSAPETLAPRTTVPVRERFDNGDLGVSVPISSVPCDGEYVVLVGSAVTPGRYGADVERFLQKYPGAQYLRTDRACTSLVQSRDGNPIYAVSARSPVWREHAPSARNWPEMRP